jgi:hypothetical protein
VPACFDSRSLGTQLATAVRPGQFFSISVIDTTARVIRSDDGAYDQGLADRVQQQLKG